MSDVLVDNPLFYNNAYFLVNYFEYLTALVFLLFIVGAFTNKPIGFLAINFAIKILFSIFMMYRFNRYRKDKIQFTDLDKKICFSAGIYIFVFSFLDVITMYIEQLQKLIDPYTIPIIKQVKSAIGI